MSSWTLTSPEALIQSCLGLIGVYFC
jgi:hypothetical protein